MFTFLGKFNQYWWKRRTKTVGTKLVNYRATDIIKTESASLNYGITYSDSVIPSTDALTLSLGSTSSVNVSYDNYTDAEILIGKYFKSAAGGKEGIYYAHPNSTITHYDGGHYYYVQTYASKVLPTFICGEWEYLQANSIDAYPSNGLVDGYEYVYIGKPINTLTEKAPVLLAYNENIGLYNSDRRKSVTINLSDDIRNYREIAVIGLGCFVYYEGSNTKYINVMIGDDSQGSFKYNIADLEVYNSYKPYSPTDSSYTSLAYFSSPIVNMNNSFAWIINKKNNYARPIDNHTVLNYRKLTFDSYEGITAGRIYVFGMR